MPKPDHNPLLNDDQDAQLSIEQLFQMPASASTDGTVRHFQGLITQARAHERSGQAVDSVVSVMSGLNAAGERQFWLASTDVTIAQALEMMVRASGTLEKAALECLSERASQKHPH